MRKHQDSIKTVGIEKVVLIKQIIYYINLMNSVLSEKSKNLLIQFIFVVSAFIHLIKLDSELCTSPAYHSPKNQTQVEHVLPEKDSYPIEFRLVGPIKEHPGSLPFHQLHHSIIYKILLIDYNHRQINQIRYLNQTPSNQFYLIVILQKSNIWHQSSNEDPPFLS